MKGKMNVILRYAAYGTLTLLLTLYFMFLTFPFTELKNRILPSLESGLPFSLRVDEIRSTPLLWLELTQLELVPMTGEKTPLLEIPELKIRPSLIDLLIGRSSLRIRADLLEGFFKGKVSRRKGNLALALSWEGIRPAKHPLLSRIQNTQMEGALSGELDMSMEANNWMTAEGTLSLDLADGSVKNLQAYGFTLPDLAGIRGNGTVRVGKRKAEVTSLTLTADQLSVSLDGSIDLSPRFSSSRLTLKGRIKLAGQLETQYQSMLSNFLRNKDSEGYFLFSLRGTLGSPRFSI
jgi:type II secretion system protein N